MAVARAGRRAAPVALALAVLVAEVAAELMPVICGVRGRLLAAEEPPESRAAELGASAAVLQAAVLREQRQRSQEDGRQLRRCCGPVQ